MKRDPVKKYIEAIHDVQPDDPLFAEGRDGLELWEKESGNHLELLEQELRSSRFSYVQADSLANRFFHSFLKYAVVASMLGVFCIAAARSYSTHADGQHIYTRYFRPQALLHSSYTDQGHAAGKDYIAAVLYYEKLVAAYPKNIRNNLFLGIALLATGQSKRSVEVLSSIRASDEFYFDIQWYLALAYLRNNEILHSKTILQKLASENNYYREPASEILQRLNGKAVSEN